MDSQKHFGAQSVLASAESLLSSCDGCATLSETQIELLTKELGSVRQLLDESDDGMSDSCRMAVLTCYAQLCDCWIQVVGKPAVDDLAVVDLDALLAENESFWAEREAFLRQRDTLETTQRAMADDCRALRQQNKELHSELTDMRSAYRKSTSIVSFIEDTKEEASEEWKGKDGLNVSEAMEELQSQLAATQSALDFSEASAKQRVDDLENGIGELTRDVRRLTVDNQLKDSDVSALTNDVNLLMTALSQQRSEMEDLYSLYTAQGGDGKASGGGRPQVVGQQSTGLWLTGAMDSGMCVLASTDAATTGTSMGAQPLSEALGDGSDEESDSDNDIEVEDDFAEDGEFEKCPAHAWRSIAFESLLASVPFGDDLRQAPCDQWSVAQPSAPLFVLSSVSRHKLERLTSAVSSKRLQRDDTRSVLRLLSESDEQSAAAGDSAQKSRLSVLEEEETGDETEAAPLDLEKKLSVVDSMLASKTSEATETTETKETTETMETKETTETTTEPKKQRSKSYVLEIEADFEKELALEKRPRLEDSGSLLLAPSKSGSESVTFGADEEFDATEDNVVISVDAFNAQQKELEESQDLTQQLQEYKQKAAAQIEELIRDKLALLKSTSETIESLRQNVRFLADRFC